MRYLKIYEEYSGGIFNSEEVDDILDVFQDIIDEYNLEKKSGDGFMRNNQYKISFVSNVYHFYFLYKGISSSLFKYTNILIYSL